MIHITNGTVLSEGKEHKWDVLIHDGKIVYAGPDAAEVLGRMNAGEVSVIDASGKYVSPGFIDIHTHGGAGADFMDGSMEAYRTALHLHTSHGTTLIYPTTLTGAKDSLLDSVKSYQEIKAAGIEGAEMGGLHFEGPYFAYSKKGAQDPRYLRNPDPEEYMELLEEAHGDIARWSLAPELPGALEMAEKISAKGVLVAMGHTDATFDEAMSAAKDGVNHATHLFNAMSALAHRNPGVVGAALASDNVSVEVIADTFHINPGLYSIVSKIKGDKMVLITDCTRAGGMPDGEYTLGGQKIIVNGIECLLEDGTIAGSVLKLNNAVKNVRDNTDLPLWKVVAAASLNPAKAIGVSDRKGSLEVGKDADIIICDSEFNVEKTIIGGEIRYEA